MKKQKDNIIDLILKLDNSNILNKLESLLFQYHFEKQHFTVLKEDELISELKLALKDIEKGRITSTSKLKEEITRWQ